LLSVLNCTSMLTSLCHAAARCWAGCKAVIATDGGEESLQLTAENPERNLPDEAVAARLTIAPLFW
jgi:hypothetical protein